MIPLRDHNPRSTFPFFTLLLILASVLLFLYELSLPAPATESFLFRYGMVPARVDLLFDDAGVTLRQAFAPLLTSMFLHAGWLHLIGNMWFLWVFGDNIEDRFGHLKFLFFYLFCGVGAGVIHTLANAGSTIPAVGASGAISGILGAYIVLYPGARILTLIPLGFLFFTWRLPAIVMLGFWFVIQFVSGLAFLGAETSGGVAWWAHIGGFALGVGVGFLARSQSSTFS